MANLKVDTISGIGTEGPVLNGGLHFRSKNYLTLPKGNTTQRIATSSGISTEIGSIRYNTDSNKMECYINNKWMIVATSTPTLDGGARGIRAGGYTQTDRIEFFTISTAGNAQDFGDKTAVGSYASGITSNTIRGLATATGYGTNSSVIESLIIATRGNSVDFGTLSQSRNTLSSTASSTRAVFSNGQTAPASQTTMDYVAIATGGQAVDFGDSLDSIHAAVSISNAHGGL